MHPGSNMEPEASYAFDDGATGPVLVLRHCLACAAVLLAQPGAGQGNYWMVYAGLLAASFGGAIMLTGLARVVLTEPQRPSGDLTFVWCLWGLALCALAVLWAGVFWQALFLPMVVLLLVLFRRWRRRMGWGY